MKYIHITENDIREMVRDTVMCLLTESSELNHERFNYVGFEFLIGIPGSGKSTYLKRISNPNVVVISPDNIRREFTGNISDQSRNADVWKDAEKRINDNLANGKYVILDATNVNTGLRRSLADRIRANNSGVKIYATTFDANPDVSKQRIRKDIDNNVDRADVPDYIIDRMNDQYNSSMESLPDEGFTQIFKAN